MLRTALCVAVALSVAAFTSTASAANLKAGDQAPDFQATGVDGKEYSLATCKDAKATVVCFTCNHCPVAVAYEDRFIEFAKKNEDQGVKFIAINVNYNENLNEMKERAEEKGFPYAYAFDASGKSCREYGARVTPHLFVLDGNGKLVYQGAFDDDMVKPKTHYVQAAVTAVLAGKAPAVSQSKPVGCGIRPKN